VQKKQGAKKLEGKPSKLDHHPTRYVDTAVLEKPSPGMEGRIPGLDRFVRVLAPDVVEFVNKLQVPDDVKGEIFGVLKDIPPEKQHAYLASIFEREWENDDG
jgi:hypothetical protein